MSSESLQSLAEQLNPFNQQHLLNWWPELDPGERAALMRQIESVDFELIQELLRNLSSTATDESGIRDRVARAQLPELIATLPKSPEEERAWSVAATRGRDILAFGKVGVILAAGGQGTRLGVTHPKGMFPIGPISGKTLFQMLAEQVVARSLQAVSSIPYYVMTSDATHAETVEFFEQNKYFGLDPDDVSFFQQGNMPAVDAKTGCLLLASKSRLATSPDGHGGVLTALVKNGLLEDMRKRGIEYLFYHHVDNPTVNVCDPAFIGLHAMQRSEFSTKVIAKRSAEERIGVAVIIDQQTQIVEYSELPHDLASKTDHGGKLLLWAGNTGIHILNRSFLEGLQTQKTAMSYHLSYKIVPHIDDSGCKVMPVTPNAFKFERFFFDAMPLAERCLLVEANRRQEFNPVKYAEGNDSPRAAKIALSAKFTEWLRNAGAIVPNDVLIEISPLFALDAEQLKERVSAGTRYFESIYLSSDVCVDSGTTKPSGPIATKLKWQELSPEDFERLIFALVSDQPGYENPDWLMQTNAPDRGRDLCVTRVLTDSLRGTLRYRVIIQCKHRLSKSISPTDVSSLRDQIRLWEPPRVDICIIATSGRFTADAVSLIERHNQSDSAMQIEVWPESHLERLLAYRPAIIAEFRLR